MVEFSKFRGSSRLTRRMEIREILRVFCKAREDGILKNFAGNPQKKEPCDCSTLRRYTAETMMLQWETANEH